MTTETRQKPKTMTKASTGNLPPLVLLKPGESIEGWMRSVDIVKMTTTEKVRGKKVSKEKERIFYRFDLGEDAQVHAGKKGADGKYPVVTFRAGDIVSLPGAGGLDTTMAKIALKIMGAPEDETEPDFSVLQDKYFKVSREEDDTMKSGEFIGNMVKVFSVEYGS